MKTTQEFSNDMMKNYDINLDTQLEGSSNKVDAFYNRVQMIVMLEIKSNNPNFRENKITEKQKEAIWKAILEQAYYMINNYDMNIVSGFDPISNSTVSIEEIRKRAFSPLARKILLTSGLLYRGIGDISYDRYVRY